MCFHFFNAKKIVIQKIVLFVSCSEMFNGNILKTGISKFFL